MQCTGPQTFEWDYLFRQPDGHFVPLNDLVDLPLTHVTDDFLAVTAFVGLYFGFFVIFNFGFE